MFLKILIFLGGKVEYRFCSKVVINKEHFESKPTNSKPGRQILFCN